MNAWPGFIVLWYGVDHKCTSMFDDVSRAHKMHLKEMHLSMSVMSISLGASGWSVRMQMIFQSSSPQSIIAYAPSTLTLYTPAVARASPPISTTSTGSLSPCTRRVQCGLCRARILTKQIEACLLCGAAEGILWAGDLMGHLEVSVMQRMGVLSGVPQRQAGQHGLLAGLPRSEAACHSSRGLSRDRNEVHPSSRPA